jgi:hypothetical protein
VAEGTAPWVFAMTPNALCAPGSGASTTCVGDQVVSEIVPGWPLPIAAAFAKLIFPKFVSGTTVQCPLERQSDGASAIHSADPTSSGAAGVTRLL